MLKNKKVAIFDLDGTIINSMDYWAKLDQKLIYSLTGILYDEDFQTLWESKMEEYHNHKAPMVSYCSYLAEEYNINISGEMLLKKREEMIIETYRSEVSAKKGVEEFIKKLYDSGLTIVIATTTGRVNVDACRENEKLGDLFEMFREVYTYEDVEKRKPNPMVHMKIMEKYGVRPKDCIIFEDSLQGVIAANRAEIDVIGVKDEQSAINKNEIIKKCIMYIESFDELLNW